ncbi:MAG TPA: RNA methyltransferase [Anaerolineales bacterium]|nr:RNA methyltransferase [Anaerolineales bacterium]
MITSSQNSKIKLVRLLLGRVKERRAANAFVAEGVRLVEEAADSSWKFQFALYDESLSERGLELVEKLENKKVEVEKVESRLLQSLSETETPQGILAVLEFTHLPIPKSPNFILIPDQIRDPGNLGTLLRTAAAAGVQAVIIPPETTDPFAPKVLRSGMGAHFRLPVHTMAWEEIQQLTKSANQQIYLADMNGVSCWEADLRQPLALIIGGEAEGASEQARKLANQQISIPMMGRMESLNAGVAGSVLMFEVVRQRSVISEAVNSD